MSINSPRFVWVERRRRIQGQNPFAFRPGQRASDIAATRDSCIPDRETDESQLPLLVVREGDREQPDQ